ncbi:hypothetical protein FDP22_22730 (plasmid) [Paroceanicella profunda]|uniref:ABC transporter permease n=1 Tax=Paroceanicella profunda TaxID=2579971 RepID=A0A5B8G5Q2_9RHOB|nr:hypothetical protein FDP22_22730 [Paroceanicella profunda]
MTDVSPAAPPRPRPVLRAWMLVLPAVLFLAGFFVAPLIDNGNRSFLGEEGGFTLARYGELLSDRFYLGVIFETVALSAGVTLISR